MRTILALALALLPLAALGQGTKATRFTTNTDSAATAIIRSLVPLNVGAATNTSGVAVNDLAPIASPTFSGIVTAPIITNGGTFSSTNILDRKNVRWWDALTASDTIAIQQAIYGATNVLTGPNGYTNPFAGKVIIPSGLYQITNTIYVPANVRILGEGSLNTILYNTSTNSTFVYVPSTNNIPEGILDIASFSGLTIAYTATNANTVGILIDATGGQPVAPIIKDVLVYKAGTGVRLKTTINAVLENVQCNDGYGNGFQIVSPANALSATACFALNNGGLGWDVVGNYMNFTACASDYNLLGGWKVEAVTTTFTSCGAEGNQPAQWTFRLCENVHMDHCYVMGDWFTGHGIILDGGYEITLSGLSLNPVGSTNGYTVYLTNAANGTYPYGIKADIHYWPSFGLGACNNTNQIEYVYSNTNLTLKGKVTAGAFGPLLVTSTNSFVPDLGGSRFYYDDNFGTTVQGKAGTSYELSLYSPSGYGILVSKANHDVGLAINGGNVGIGHSSPLSRLHVVGSLYDVSNPGNIISQNDIAVSANSGGGILFGGNYTGAEKTIWSGISGLKENATDGEYGGSLLFLTRPNGGANTVRMVVSASGNVGIGTTTPVAKLDVNGNIKTVLTNVSLSTDGNGIIVSGGGSGINLPLTVTTLIGTNGSNAGGLTRGLVYNTNGADAGYTALEWHTAAGTTVDYFYQDANGLRFKASGTDLVIEDGLKIVDLSGTGTRFVTADPDGALGATGVFTGDGSGLTNLTSAIKAGTTNITALTTFTVVFDSAWPTTNYTALAIGNGFALAAPYAANKTTTSVTFNFGIATGFIDWQAVLHTQ